MNNDILAIAVVAGFLSGLALVGLWRVRSRRRTAILLAGFAAPVVFLLSAFATINTPMDGFSTEFIINNNKSFERDVSMSLGRGTYLAALHYSSGPKEELDLRYDLKLDGELVENRHDEKPAVLDKDTNNYSMGLIRIKKHRGEVTLSISISPLATNSNLPIELSIARIW